MTRIDPAAFVDTRRYPVDAPPATPGRERVVAELRQRLATDGVAILPGFLNAAALERTTADVDQLVGRAHLEDVWGTPYLGLPDESFPEGHPRRTSVHSLTNVVAYDLVPPDNPVRILFEWDPLKDFLGDVVGRGTLYRMDDPLGALNLTAMTEGHVQGWHYDSTDFVVSIALRASEGGGEFECFAGSRTDDDERYDDVARVLSGDGGELVSVYPMTPGTLMIFEGRRSLHRVSPVSGSVSRVVALLGYDTVPGTTSSEILRLVRYGRTEPLTPAP
jgi:hypothetical protein